MAEQALLPNTTTMISVPRSQCWGWNMFDSIFGAARNMGVLFAVGLLGILTAVFLMRALASMRRAGASRAWPSIPGTILSSNVVAGRRPGRNGISYYPSVMYEYHVNGQ